MADAVVACAGLGIIKPLRSFPEDIAKRMAVQNRVILKDCPEKLP